MEEVLAFQQKNVEQDHAEALRINELYDTSGSLHLAFMKAEDEFTKENPNMPGAQEFGYCTAKNAVRWWSYMTAYVRDLEIAGPNEEVSQANIDRYGQDKNDLGDLLLDHRPAIAFRTLDLMQKERIRRSLHSQAEVSPLDMGRKYSALAMTTTLEVVFEKRDAAVPAERGAPLIAEHEETTYLIEKPPRLSMTGAPAYIISEFEAGSTERVAGYIAEGSRSPQKEAFIVQTETLEPEVGIAKTLEIAHAAQSLLTPRDER